ncbi:hypothetical protein BKA70DRAFT_1437476 [Coprinopsis sp. MPI-PUGE-AT-0042]|nr:hypothetical protein BKA70DRAFT_1437476 [Coprinopsis sp. MPI-PUGE-AT-0042]
MDEAVMAITIDENYSLFNSSSTLVMGPCLVMEFTQPRGRKRKERYDYEPPEQTDGPQPLTQLEEHTAYSYEHNEARKTFLQVPVSPSKPRRSKPEEAANSHLPHGQHSDVSNWEGFGFDGGLADTSENQDGEEEREKLS